MRTSSASLLAGFLVVAVLTTAGCGSGNTPGANQPKAPGGVKKAAGPASTLSPYLVGAVAAAKGGPALFDVRFEVAGRPDVGDPVDVDVVIVPLKDIVDRFSGTVQGDDGLDVVAGDSIASMEKPAAGTPVHQAVKVVARRDGIFTLTVNLSVTAAGQPLSTTYSLPIIAGNGLTDAGTTPAAAAGQPRPKPPAAAQ
jgi:hypothetical protein